MKGSAIRECYSIIFTKNKPSSLKSQNLASRSKSLSNSVIQKITKPNDILHKRLLADDVAGVKGRL